VKVFQKKLKFSQYFISADNLFLERKGGPDKKRLNSHLFKELKKLRYPQAGKRKK